MSRYIRKTLRKTENSDKNWTEDEDRFLTENYEALGSKGVAAALGRIPSACRNRAYRLKITKNITWTSEEKQFLQENYGRRGAAWVSEQLGRSKSSCIAYARKLGIKRDYR